MQATWSLAKDVFLPICGSGGRKVPLDPKINVLRDFHSLHYKECWLGDNPEAACQSKNSLGTRTGVSVGGVEQRRQLVMHLCLIVSHQVHSCKQSATKGGVPACGHLAHVQDAVITRCGLESPFE